MFSTLRKGATVYILDQTSKPEVKIGYVDNVTLPRPMYPTYNPAASLGTNMQSVVDVTVRINEEKREFCVPSNLSIHTYGDYTLSESKEAMISEVDSLLKDREDKIDNTQKYKEDVVAFKDILKALNPVYAKEEQRDEAIDNLTKRVDGMYSALERLESLLRNKANGND